MTFLTALGGRAWAILAAVVGILALYLKARSDGRKSAENDGLRNALDTVGKANESRRTAVNPDGTPAERVRKFYTD
jgi:hypothetical protein